LFPERLDGSIPYTVYCLAELSPLEPDYITTIVIVISSRHAIKTKPIDNDDLMS